MTPRCMRSTSTHPGTWRRGVLERPSLFSRPVAQEVLDPPRHPPRVAPLAVVRREQCLLLRHDDEQRLRERGGHPRRPHQGVVAPPHAEVAYPQLGDERPVELARERRGAWLEVIHARPVVHEWIHTVGEGIGVDRHEHVRIVNNGTSVYYFKPRS